jgi:transposase
MSQTVAAQIPAAVDYESTLILAIKVSNKSWVLAAQVPGLPHMKAKRTIDPEAEALLAAKFWPSLGQLRGAHGKAGSSLPGQ